MLPEEVPEQPSGKFLMKTTNLTITDQQLVKTLGIGIHDDSPVIRILPVDKGTRDWDNHRIIVAMPSGS